MNDSGLAADRTTLAWTRTTLGAAALGILLLHAGTVHDSPLTMAAAAAALVDAVVIGLAGRHRAAARPPDEAIGRTAVPMLVAVVTALTLLAGATSALAIIVSH